MFDHSYASGSPDSGFYIGQCNPCHAVITDVVSEYNQLGLLGYQLERRSLHRELGVAQQPERHRAQQPRQRRARAAGSWRPSPGTSWSPTATPTPRRCDDAGSTPLFGVGIAHRRERGRRRHQEPGGRQQQGRDRARPRTRAPRARLPVHRQRSPNNVSQGSGLADLATILPTADDRNCFAGNTLTPRRRRRTSSRSCPASGTGTGDPNTGALAVGQFLDTSRQPAGRGLQAAHRSRRSSATWRAVDGEGPTRRHARRRRPRLDHRCRGELVRVGVRPPRRSVARET